MEARAAAALQLAPARLRAGIDARAMTVMCVMDFLALVSMFQMATASCQ